MQLLFRNNIAGFSTPTATASGGTITVTGQIDWFKEGVWGIAYKKSSASSWTYKSTASKNINATINNATASTTYQIKLYVKFDNAYQYSETVSVTTD